MQLFMPCRSFYYVTLGFLVLITFGSDTLNDLTNVIIGRLRHFIFGAFEITLPSSIINKTDSAVMMEVVGNIFHSIYTFIGILFHACLPCHGQIIGTLLVGQRMEEVTLVRLPSWPVSLLSATCDSICVVLLCFPDD